MQQRAEWLDFIKVFAVLTTLFLHSNSTLVNFQTTILAHPVELNMGYWKTSAVFASFVGPSLALIFMYLGAVVLTSKHSKISFFFGKVKNLLIPLVFWTLFALLFQKYVMHLDTQVIESLLLATFKPVANNLYILYYLIALFLIVPVLKIFVNNSTTRQQLYLVVLWLYAVTIPPLIQKYYHIDINSYLPMMTGFVGYLLLGYILSKIELTKNLLMLGALFFVLGNSWTIASVIYYSLPEMIAKGIYASYGYDRFSIPMIMSTISSFILLRYFAERIMNNPFVYITIQHISSVALGMCMVYTYWFVILGTEKIGIELTAFSGNPLWSVPLTAIVTIVASYVTVYVIKKIPYLRKVTPTLI